MEDVTSLQMLRHGVGLARELHPEADDRLTPHTTAASTQRRHLPRHGRRPEARGDLERRRRSVDRRARSTGSTTRSTSDSSLREMRRGHPTPERIPAQIVLGCFLPHPTAPRVVDFDPTRLLRDGESLGWDLVRARARPGRLAAFGLTSGAGSGLSLRGRAVRALPALPAAGGRPPRRQADRALPQAPRALVPRARRAAARSSSVVHTLLDRGARGLGLEAGAMSTLLIDNYDSYTYNVFHLLAAVCGRGADRGAQRHGLLAGALALGLRRDRALPRPGPPRALARLRRLRGHPAPRESPVLGVCLGHQGHRPHAQRAGHERAARDARPAQPRSATTATASSRGSPRASRWCATTRSWSAARWGPRDG